MDLRCDKVQDKYKSKYPLLNTTLNPDKRKVSAKEQQQIPITQQMIKESESHNFLIILSLLLIGCGDPHSQNERSKKISIANFNENVWKADTLGCQNKRIDLAMVLRDSMQKCLVGKSKASLIELLGPPNTTHFHRGDTVYTYFVRSDRQCYDTLWRENGSHAEQLLIFISKDGNISGSTGLIYP